MNDYFDGAQEVNGFICTSLKQVASEYISYACGSVWCSREEIKYSGRIQYTETRSYTDGKDRIVCECCLHLGFAALGSVRAVQVTSSVRARIWIRLQNALPKGCLSVAGPVYTVHMKDGTVRLRSMLDGGRSVIHVRAQYAPAFYGWV